MAAALEKANKEAGYDIPLAFAALNTVIINEQVRCEIPMFERQVDASAVADVVLRANDNKLDVKAIGMLIEFGMVYGWHRALHGESILKSGDVLNQLMEFIDKSDKLTIEEKVQRKKGINLGYIALQNAVKKVEGVAKLQRELKR